MEMEKPSDKQKEEHPENVEEDGAGKKKKIDVFVNEVTDDAPKLATNAVLVPSNEIPKDAIKVQGYDFGINKQVDYDLLLQSYRTIGFQATNFGLACEQIEQMLKWRLSDEPIKDDEDGDDSEIDRSQVRCKIFFSYTSNLISSGLRDIFCYLVKNRMVDVVVTSAGGIEEDLIKCLAPTYLGEFSLKGSMLRSKGLNRVGNLLVPNDNYCKFEDWINPILDSMLDEQKKTGKIWTPSAMIHRFGLEINDERSVCYWCAKNNIPIFSPALTDGSIGDMVYFHSYKNPGLIIDIAGDIRLINDEALRAKKTGMIILGGGVIKHHVCNANLMRNGADFSVYVNTANEFDGSDAGASPDEAISWGKIRHDAKPVKVYGEASLIFPILVAQTFVKHFVPKPSIL